MSFSHPDLDDFVDFALRLAAAARAQTLSRFRAEAAIVNKAGASFDPVTDADREAERALREMIAAAYPDHGVLGEEFGETKGQGPWRWVLDPVDGTRAFVCGVPSWTTLIALEHDGAPALGLIDQPFTDECWISAGGTTRYRHAGQEKKAATSGVASLAEARISTTDPMAAGYFSEAEAAAFARVAAEAQVARYSLDAYAYALLALGELDLVIESALQRHDYAALVPVVENAGGVITDWRGVPAGTDDRGRIVAAATPALHQTALALLATA